MKEPKKGILTQIPKRFLNLSVKYGEDENQEEDLDKKSLFIEEKKKKRFFDFIAENKEDFWAMYNNEANANKDPAYLAMFDTALPRELKGKTKSIEIIHLTGTSFKKEEGLELLDLIQQGKDDGIVKFKRDYENVHDQFAINVIGGHKKNIGFVPMKTQVIIKGESYNTNYVVAANMEKELFVTAQIVDIKIIDKNTPAISIVIGWTF